MDFILRPESISTAPSDDAWQAPSFLDAEFTSALRGHLLGGHLDDNGAHEALRVYTALQLVRWPIDQPLQVRMLQLRHNLSAYDASYVALAEALDAPLLTRDAGMARGAPPGVRVEVA